MRLYATSQIDGVEFDQTHTPHDQKRAAANPAATRATAGVAMAPAAGWVLLTMVGVLTTSVVPPVVMVVGARVTDGMTVGMTPPRPVVVPVPVGAGPAFAGLYERACVSCCV